jgi:hypothetical protein
MALFGDSEIHNSYWYVSAGSCGVYILSSYPAGIFNKNKNMPDVYLTNFPNPFSQSTVIGYQLPVSSKVVLKVYGILGYEIRTLINSNQLAGKHSVVWDGTTDTGEPAVSGIYFCKLNIDNKPISTIYIMLLK